MSTRDEVLTGVTGSAAFGIMVFLGLGVARDTGLEPWLAGALALGLVLPTLSRTSDTLRPATDVDGLKGAWRGGWRERTGAWGAIALALFVTYLAIWLGFGVRYWALGVLCAGAALMRIYCAAMVYQAQQAVPRWCQTPTLVLLTAQALCSGLLGLSAIEGLLGFPPGLVLWKAALALIGLTLLGHYWETQAAEVPMRDASVRTDAFAEHGRPRARLLLQVSVGLGLALPMALALIADGQTERVLLPIAFMSHLAGVAAHRWLFLALATRAPSQTLQ